MDDRPSRLQNTGQLRKTQPSLMEVAKVQSSCSKSCRQPHSTQSQLFTSFAVPKLAGLATEWARVLHLGRCCRYPAGAIIDLQGEAVFDLLYLEKGSLRIVYETFAGRTRSVIIFEDGCIANLAPAVTRKNASGYYQCITNSTIYHFPGKLLNDHQFY